MISKIKHTKRGFTIVEVSTAGLLIVVLGIGVLGLQKIMTDAQIFGFANYTNVDEANLSISQMAREMRTMRSGQNGAYAFVSGTENEIIFYSDIDFDGVSERVRYFLENNTLYKGVIEPVGFPATYPTANEVVKTLSRNVEPGESPLFLYFNENWPVDTINNPLPTPVNIAEVRFVRISLNVNVNPVNAERSVYSLGTNVSLRILKDNL